MNVDTHPDLAVSRIASAIGAPARARILYSLLDGHARTSTELAVIADVNPSTASVHLNLLRSERLIKVLVQGKHRFYSLQGPIVAKTLEGLSVLAGANHERFVPNTPSHLRIARTCYDHMAGAAAVLLHNRFKSMGWLVGKSNGVANDSYDLTRAGINTFTSLGIDVAATRNLRRRFAYACLDWSERQPHIGGALGAALLRIALKRKWVVQELDSRALSITSYGRREIHIRFGLQL
ncbi:MAG TPA: helix-turn-helix transcriptional regulator [Candidatus Limnocylindrales bacterium]|nr:helix-turn-helix transcriptional regulator [Candidatus Limnocylindrales bacterium]